MISQENSTMVITLIFSPERLGDTAQNADLDWQQWNVHHILAELAAETNFLKRKLTAIFHWTKPKGLPWIVKNWKEVGVVSCLLPTCIPGSHFEERCRYIFGKIAILPSKNPIPRAKIP